MEPPRTTSAILKSVRSPAKVDPTWNAGLSQILVTQRRQRRSHAHWTVVGFPTHHQVDYWFIYQTGHGNAANMLNPNIRRQPHHDSPCFERPSPADDTLTGSINIEHARWRGRLLARAPKAQVRGRHSSVTPKPASLPGPFPEPAQTKVVYISRYA